MNIKRLIMITFLFACYGAGMVGSNKIDRKALVMRHNVTQTIVTNYPLFPSGTDASAIQPT